MVWLILSVKVSSNVLLQATPEQHYQGLLTKLNFRYFQFKAGKELKD